MKYSVKRVSVHQSSKTLAVLYGILGVVYIPIMLLANSGSLPEERIPGIVIWLLPIILCGLSYVMMAITFALYNAVANVVGGIQFTLDDARSVEP